jgi:hypothetical protein
MEALKILSSTNNSQEKIFPINNCSRAIFDITTTRYYNNRGSNIYSINIYNIKNINNNININNIRGYKCKL